MRNIRILAYIILVKLVLSSQICHAQEKIFVHYKIEDGLLSNMIYATLQDKQGFIWIATDNGICQFDGKRFKRFSTSNGLPDNDILSMSIDQDDRIWFFTFNRNIGYILHDQIHTKDTGPSFTNIELKSYARLQSTIRDGIIFLDESTNTCYKTNHKGGIDSIGQNIRALDLQENTIYFHRDKIVLLNKRNQILHELNILNYDLNDYTSYQIGRNHFVIHSATSNLIGEISNKRVRLKPLEKQKYSSQNAYNASHQLWVTTALNQITLLDTNLKLQTHKSIQVENSIINHFFIDQSGGYWIGTKGNGIYYFPNISISTFNEKNGLIIENIEQCQNYDNELFMLSANKQIQHLKNNKISQFKVQLPNSIAGINKTLYVNNNFIVSGNSSGSLFIFNRKSNKSLLLPNYGSSKDIELDYEQKILLSTNSGLYSFDLKTNKRSPIAYGRVTCAYRLDKDNVIVGAVNKISVIDYKINDTQYSAPLPVKEFIIHNTTISDIKKYKSTVIVATVESGIYLYDNNRFQKINTQNGLTDNNCKHIFVAKDGTIWISTASGINCITIGISIHDFKVKNITTSNGLPTNNIKNIDQINDTMYAASSKGIIQFPSNIFDIEKEHPKVLISEILVDSKPISRSNSSISIFKSDLKIEFTGIDYKSLGNINYYYRIKELNPKWKLITSNFINLDRLKPNNYLLEIHAKNSKNVWSIEPAQLRIIVKPYWWQTDLFNFIFYTSILFLVYYITRYFIKRNFTKKLNAEALEKQMSEIELKALKAQINPHFIFNTLNAIQYFIQNNENEKAETYVNKMSSLIRNTLNFSNETSIMLSEEIEYLQNYLDLEALRFDDDFKYTIERNFSMNLNGFQIPTMVMQPHIENAIRHGLKPKRNGPKCLALRFNEINNYLICEIEDNGIGRMKSKMLNEQNNLKHSSQGDQLSTSKLNLFKKMSGKLATIEIQDLYHNDNPTGTLVKIKIEL